MGIRDTLFAIITFVLMVYNGVIMETRFADDTVQGCDYYSTYDTIISIIAFWTIITHMTLRTEFEVLLLAIMTIAEHYVH